MAELKTSYVTVQLPEIPDREVSIASFGAVEGVICTDAFRQAMRSLGEKGGTVRVPAGDWLTGPIEFSSHVRLHLEKGAVVRFSGNIADYRPARLSTFEGVRCYRLSSLLHAENCTDIAISGEGIFDGNGSAWWDMCQYTSGVKHMLASAKAGGPVEERVYDTFVQGVRPSFLEFVNCSRISIEGVTFKDSPMWTVHPLWSDNIHVRGIRIDNPMEDRFHHSQNTDGVNLDSCRNALVEDCEIFCGDDCVCMKSGKDEDGLAVGRVCENVEVRNCRFLRGIGGITIGSETSGGIRNLYCHDIDMGDVCIGVWIKSAPSRGAFIENLSYDNIHIGSVACEGICLTLGYTGAKAGQSYPFAPKIRNISVKNLTLDKGHTGVRLQGLPGYEPTNIRLENISVKAMYPLTAEDVLQVEMINCSFVGDPDFSQVI